MALNDTSALEAKLRLYADQAEIADEKVSDFSTCMNAAADAIALLTKENEQISDELAEAHTHFAIQEGRIRDVRDENARLRALLPSIVREILDEREHIDD